MSPALDTTASSQIFLKKMFIKHFNASQKTHKLTQHLKQQILILGVQHHRA